ncbi:kinase-like domain-containing protein [Baffinella frigidus]|nr:kinase-like domain-containing protein [Cryptophyta sp. CCMP2293]
MPALQQDASTRRGESFVPRRPPSFRDFVFLVALGTLLGSEAFMPLALNQRGSLGFCRPRATGVLSPARMSAINKRPLDPQVATSWCQINLVLTMHRKIRTWLARKAKASSAMHGESGGGGGCENNSEQGHGGRLGSVAARWNDSAVATRSALLVGPDARERKREAGHLNELIAMVVYVSWNKLREEHLLLESSSLEVHYKDGLLGSGAFGQVYEGVVRGGAHTGQRVVAKRAKDGAIDLEDPDHEQQAEEDIVRGDEDDLDLKRRLLIAEMRKQSFHYLQMEALMNDLVMKLCPSVAAHYLGQCRRNNTHWLVWEYAGDNTLQSLLEEAVREGSLRPVAEALGVEGFLDHDVASLQTLVNAVALDLLEICVALEAAGVAHRDLKPDNMVVDPVDKRLRLIDFGSAAAMGLEKRVGYDCRAAPCDPLWAPPEEYIDEKEWAKYDVYGVGLVLVRILFQPLWGGEDWIEFRDGYEAAHHNLDAWLARTIARDRTIKGAVRKETTRWLRALTWVWFGSQDLTARDQEYVDLAGASCENVVAGEKRLNMCNMQLGLQVLNIKKGGICWDTLRQLLSRDPKKRMSAEQALSRVHHAVAYDHAADEAARQVRSSVLDTPSSVLNTPSLALATPSSVLGTPLSVLDTILRVLNTSIRVLDTECWTREVACNTREERMSAEQALSRVHHAVPYDHAAEEAARQARSSVLDTPSLV